MRIKPKLGFIYYLREFTGPKVFMGDRYECLLTDQKLSATEGIYIEIGHIKDWRPEIYLPERFTDLLNN